MTKKERELKMSIIEQYIQMIALSVTKMSINEPRKKFMASMMELATLIGIKETMNWWEEIEKGEEEDE